MSVKNSPTMKRKADFSTINHLMADFATTPCVQTACNLYLPRQFSI